MSAVRQQLSTIALFRGQNETLVACRHAPRRRPEVVDEILSGLSSQGSMTVMGFFVTIDVLARAKSSPLCFAHCKMVAHVAAMSPLRSTTVMSSTYAREYTALGSVGPSHVYRRNSSTDRDEPWVRPRPIYTESENPLCTAKEILCDASICWMVLAHR